MIPFNVHEAHYGISSQIKYLYRPSVWLRFPISAASMKHFHFLVYIAVVLLWAHPLQAQYKNLPVEGWREHLPMNKGLAVVDAGDKVYAATELGVIVLRKDDQSVELLGKSDGLSDLLVSCIGYHSATNTVIIGYKTGNIDLLRNNEIENLGDIKRSGIILGKKEINRIKFRGSEAYLCTSFGIVVLNMERREVQTTLFPTENNANVWDVDFHSDSIYAATDAGLRVANMNDPALSYSGTWTNFMGVGQGRPVNGLCWHEEALYFTRYVPYEFAKDTLYRVNGTALEVIRDQDNFRSIRSSRGFLLVSQNYNVLVKAPGSSEFASIYSYGDGISPSPSEAQVDAQDTDVVWIADLQKGLVRAFRIFGITLYTPEGPASKNVFRLRHADSKLWVATGSYDLAFSPLYFIDGIMKREGPDWTSYSFPYQSDWLRDMVSVAADPTNSDHVFVATWGKGVAEITNGQLTALYDTTNSGLNPINVASPEVRVSDLTTEANGKLWIANASSPTPVVLRKPDGSWKSYSFNSYANNRNTQDIITDSLGQVWVAIQDRGLVVMRTDENDDLDKYRVVTDQANAGALNSLKVFSMAVDRDGLVWVGTAKGVNVFYSPEAILEENSGNWDGQKIVVSQGGFDQYLLNSEEVTAIAVDGANRKWFGTRSAGVFLTSADGLEQLYQFNTENSPLLSNTINSISIDHTSGEVFFGTSQGICSFRSDAIRAGKTFGKVYAYPNPVEHDYHGLVSVTGLAEDAEVKITDVAGNVVFSGRANGGLLTWNGKLYSGERAATGVYLIFCTNDDGSQTQVSKMLFIH